jgi:hypothetical protein
LIAGAVLLALAGPGAAVCANIAEAPAGTFLADDNAHRALRAELGVATPTDPEHITIYAEGGHLATSRISIIATHRPDGRWAVDAVGRSKIWVDGATPSDMPHVTRVLSVEDGEQIDWLLDNPAFWHSRVADRDERAPPLRGEIPRRIAALTPNCAQHWVTSGNAPPLVALLDRLITPD